MYKHIILTFGKIGLHDIIRAGLRGNTGEEESDQVSTKSHLIAYTTWSVIVLECLLLGEKLGFDCVLSTIGDF